MVRTYLDGGNTEATGLENDANAAGRHTFAKSAHHSSCHHHILHLYVSLSLVNFYLYNTCYLGTNIVRGFISFCIIIA